MTTTKQVKELVRPLLERHQDLVLSQRYLMIVPFDHFARRILIDRCSSPDLFVPSWSLTEMFMPSSTLLAYGWCHESIYTPRRGGGSWSVSDPTMARDFVEVVENKVLPLLRSLDSFQACMTFAFGHPAMAGRIGREWSVMMRIAEGDLETARREWQGVGRKYVTGGKDWLPACQDAYDIYCEIGDLLLADDRAGLATLLHRLEATAIVGSRVEPYWRRAPFPLEVEATQHQ